MNFIKDILIPCVCVTAAAFSYGVVFHIKGKKLLIAAIGGILSWTVYLLTDGIYVNDIPQYFIAACAVSAYSEIMARITKTPVTLYLVVVILPLVPGGLLYYTMEEFILGNGDIFLDKLLYAFGVAGSIALGVFLISTIARLITVGRGKIMALSKNNSIKQK